MAVAALEFPASIALNLVRQVADKRSIKRRRKRAAWDPGNANDPVTEPMACLPSAPQAGIHGSRQRDSSGG